MASFEGQESIIAAPKCGGIHYQAAEAMRGEVATLQRRTGPHSDFVLTNSTGKYSPSENLPHLSIIGHASGDFNAPVLSYQAGEAQSHCGVSFDRPPSESDAQKSVIEATLPPLEKFEDAAKKAGITMDPATLRDAFEKHEQHDLDNGSLKMEDLSKFPRVGGAFVATGAVSEAEMDATLAKQSTLGPKPPRIGNLLEEIYKNDPVKLAKIRNASRFYDELHTN